MIRFEAFTRKHNRVHSLFSTITAPSDRSWLESPETSLLLSGCRLDLSEGFIPMCA